MTDSVSIVDVSTSGNVAQMLNRLAKFNYVAGANTIDNITVRWVNVDEGKFSSWKEVWRSGTMMWIMVNSQDFVDQNFKQSVQLSSGYRYRECRHTS